MVFSFNFKNNIDVYLVKLERIRWNMRKGFKISKLFQIKLLNKLFMFGEIKKDK